MVVVVLVAAGVALVVCGAWQVLGGVGGTRRKVTKLADDVGFLRERFEREIKARASTAGVQARNVNAEIRDLLAAQRGAGVAGVAVPEEEPTSRAALVARAPRRRSTKGYIPDEG